MTLGKGAFELLVHEVIHSRLGDKINVLHFPQNGGDLHRGELKTVCSDLSHCSLLFKSDPNAVFSPPDAVFFGPRVPSRDRHY